MLDLCPGTLPSLSHPYPAGGLWGGGGFRVTVWVLSLIFKPPPPPLSVDPYTIHSHSHPLLSFQVAQSLHCSRGVVITGAAEIGQDKGTLPAEDVFPLSFLFSSTSSFPLLPCFPFASHIH